MNSIKTKSNQYSLVNGKAIAGVVLVPEAGHFRAYVAWEWEERAKEKCFAIIESSHLVGHFTQEWINTVADYGTDVTHKKEVRKLFPHLF
jgi:hypothetical protein